MTRARLVLAAAALVAAGRATAFQGSKTESGKQLFWPMRSVTYLVNPPDSRSASCTGSPDPAVAAVTAGFAQWDQQSCTDLQLVNGGMTAEIRIGLLGQAPSPGHVVVFRDGWCSQSASTNCFDDASQADWSTVALTTVLYNVNTGEIADADIELNGWDGSSGSIEGNPSVPHGWYFTCGDQPATECSNYGDSSCTYMDLLNTVTHEAGHFIGLSHPCNAGGEPSLPTCNGIDPDITMFATTFPGKISQRDLSADDVNGVCSIYPPPADDDGCGCASTGPASLVPFALLALALRRRPLRRR